MADTGFTPVFIYASGTTSNVPSASNLTNTTNGSEIALNYFDGNLFYKNASNSVVTVPLLQSSGSKNGWLSSTDWTTFNNKQPAGSYALTTGTLAQFASTTSAQLAGVISDETGSGSLVFGTSPTIATPTLTGDATCSAGNLVIGTSGKGISFSGVTPPAGNTSQLLSDYEEGIFTPTITALTGTYTTIDSQSGRYTKIGNVVYFQAAFRVVNKGTGTVGAKVSGLPYTTGNTRSIAYGANTSNVNCYTVYIPSGNTYCEIYKYDGTDPIVANYTNYIDGFYYV